MGMYDRFFFAKGLLPDNKVEPDYEFQTKSLECGLDTYRVAADGTVSMEDVYYGNDQKIINEAAVVYSHVFVNDKNTGKHLKTKYQAYKILIHNSKLVFVEKLSEEGYDDETV